MDFKKHFELRDKHAFLSASNYHWINYDEDRLRERWKNFRMAQEGTRLHAFAAECIALGQRLPKAKRTLNLYVNDAIGYRMQPEQILYYSENCFGTADAISFRKDKNGKSILRIHDLKTGVTPACMSQLHIYSALFCLEYGFDPSSIGIVNCLYQSDEVLVDEPEPEEISSIMDKIIFFDKCIEEMKLEE